MLLLFYLINETGYYLFLYKHKEIKNISLLRRFYIKKNKSIYYNFYVELINIIFIYLINIHIYLMDFHISLVNS